MSSLVKLANQIKNLEAGGRINLSLYGASDLTAHVYEIVATVKHTNSGSLSVQPIAFWENIFQQISLQLGTGSEIFDLGIREHIIRQIKSRKKLGSFINKNSGEVESKINLIIDLESIGFMSPKDSVIYTGNYADKNIFIKASQFDEVANCTINSVSIKLKETFLQNMNPPINARTGKEVKILKRPILKTDMVSGATNSYSMRFPENSAIAGVYLFAVKTDGTIVEDLISKITVKNSTKTIIEEDFKELHDQNQLDFFPQKQDLYKGTVFIDFANGKYSRSINTNIDTQKFTDLVLSVNPKGANDIEFRALFETFENA